MPPAITASPHLVTPSRAYCTAPTSSSPQPSPSRARMWPRRKNSHQNGLCSKFSYVTGCWRFGLRGKTGMKTVCACLFLLLLHTLRLGDHQATAAVPGPKGCYDPADYGAKPNDDIDDRVPAQQALDDAGTTGGRVCFGTGVWTLTRAPLGSYNRFAAL